MSEDIWLSSRDQDLVKEYVKQPLYKYLDHKLDDNDSKIKFLKNLLSSYPESILNLPTLAKEQLKQITCNILKSLSWDDYATFYEIKDGFRSFISVKKKDLEIDEFFAYDEIQRNFEPLTFSELNHIYSQRPLSNFQYLEIKDDNLKEYSFSEPWSKKIKSLTVESWSLENLIFTEYASNLSKLNFKDSYFLTKIEFSTKMEKLSELNLENTYIKEIIGIHYLINLFKLDLKEAKSIQSLEFTEDNKNLRLYLTGSGITQRNQIKGIEHLDEDKITW
ncbi:MAG: hypothetical protein ACRYGR_08010 [Janthinobacterium lividum]